jgi:pyruvate/2-oxoglutarate dehydrogenase complex dihydrolipoamide dehydrogenase (E3) component
MSQFDYDFFIIGGGGSAGFTAATTALKQKVKVGMVEEARLGGLCILAGCMPSKTLLHAAARAKAGGGGHPSDHAAIIQRKRSVVDYLAGSRVDAVEAKRKLGLEVLSGRAVFSDDHTVLIDGKPVTAAKFMIATGSREFVPDLPGLAEAGFLTSNSLMDSNDLPESLIVLGGGAISLELAQYALRMGVKVSLIQRSAHLLSKEDPRIGTLLEQALADEGAQIFTGTELLKVESAGGMKTVHFNHQGKPRSLTAAEILLALGRVPNSENLGLEKAGVDTQRGAVKVNRRMQTSQPHIFAGGDVTGVNMVVNLAVLHGETAGYNATHEQMREVDDAVLPRAVFTDPQMARVGLNAAEAKQAGLDFLEADYDLSGMGTAKTYAEPPRGILLIRARTDDGRLIGAELVAPEASLMIHDVAVALKLGGTARDLASIPYIHPSLAEVTTFAAGRLAAKLAKL